LAYLNQSPDEEELVRPQLSGAGGSAITNADRLGSFSGSNVGVSAIYSNLVVRLVSRDYRAWQTMDWRLSWEGSIPGTESLTGQIKCSQASENQATCVGNEEDSARLVDDR